MIEIVTIIGLFVLGAAMGSFAAAQVWRLRVKQLAADKKVGTKIAKKDRLEVRALQGRVHGVVSDRSMCLQCGRQLAWYDLLPVVSWLVARGRCRTCHSPIGKMEILAEVLLGAMFVVSYLAWPYGFETQGIVFFALWLIVLVLLAIHWMYDAKWFLLLDRITFLFVIVAGLYFLFGLAGELQVVQLDKLVQTGLTLALLPGFYGLLYLVSRGSWIGFGDVKLLVGMALMVPRWEYGLLLIFLANLLGCLVLLPAIVSKRLTRTARIPFGPFLIAAFVITFLYGRRILDWYFSAMLF